MFWPSIISLFIYFFLGLMGGIVLGHFTFSIIFDKSINFSASLISRMIFLGQVVRELQHSRNGVTVLTEDGSVYEANYVILSVSIGVLKSQLISFNPPLPVRLIFLFKLFNTMFLPTYTINGPSDFWPGFVPLFSKKDCKYPRMPSSLLDVALTFNAQTVIFWPF